MEKVKVKMLRTQSGPVHSFKKGSEYEIDADRAERWVTNKIAIYSDPGKVETATKKTKVETATKKGA